jgi:phospholipid/cholesterol/gamma-HCH transport system substrate-binding protein
LKAEYDNVQGLTPASYVQMQGFNVGTVKAIELSKEHPGKVLVTMSIDKKLVINQDAKASIVSLDLLGTKAVSILQGKSNIPVKENQLIVGDVALGTIESLGASATPAIDHAKTAIDDLNVTIKSINNILDPATQTHLKSALADMSKTMKDFSQFANELNAQRTKITSLINNLNSFAGNLDKNGATITRVLNNTEATTANLKKLDLEGTLSELKSIMAGMQTTLNKINTGNGSMALLMNDDKLYKNLKNTLSTANTLLADINARPSRYINVAVFGKKIKAEGPLKPAPNSND